MIIRKAVIKDLTNIMKMYKSCLAGMLKQGINQWDESYPNAEIITQDIQAESYYVVEQNSEIIGGINIDQKQDPTYRTINWKDTANAFLVVHRLGVKAERWSDGIGKMLMGFTKDLVKEKQLKSIRLDTYSGNPKAMAFYLNLGYTKLGAINLKPNKAEYYCFEKVIK